VTASDENPSGNRLGQFGIAFAILGTLIGSGMLAVIIFFLYTVVHSGFD
jgi:hypothetical protein